MTILSDSIIRNISELFKRGWSRPNVCAKTGISLSSFGKWWRRGTDILEQYDYDNVLAKKEIRKNKTLTRIDKKMMLMEMNFVCSVQEAVAEEFGKLEEVAYKGALNDDSGKTAIELLGRRRPKTWAKQVAPPLVIESHPIKQIIIHGSGDVKQLEEPMAVEAEFEDV